LNRRRDIKNRRHAAHRHGKFSTLLMAALAGLLLLAVLLSVVVAVLGPMIATAIVAFVGGLGGLVLLHYVTWGWWLGGMIRRDVEADESWQAGDSTTKTDGSTTSDGGSSGSNE
jgi:hypothetical protein